MNMAETTTSNLLDQLTQHVAEISKERDGLRVERVQLWTMLLKLTNYCESFPSEVEGGDELRELIVQSRSLLNEQRSTSE